MKVLCTMGFFDDSGEGRLIEADLRSGSWRVLMSYIPPKPLRTAAKGFTGACWEGVPGKSPLWVCGHSALYHVHPHSFQVEEIWHQPCMNDLHHVAVSQDRVYLVNTGLESLDVLSLAGRFLGSHAMHPGWLSAARQAGAQFGRDSFPDLLDLRWPPSRAPEAAPLKDAAGYYDDAGERPFFQRKARDFYHPNHVELVGPQVLVTQMIDRSVHDISTFSPVIEDTPGLPHDGVHDGDLFWLTCVSGLVVGYAVERGRVTGRRVRQLDLFATTGHSGWCRGLLVTPEHLVVGLAEIKPNRLPRYRWCDRSPEGTETSILCVDRHTGDLVSRVDLTDRERQSKIFSILPLEATT